MRSVRRCWLVLRPPPGWCEVEVSTCWLDGRYLTNLADPSYRPPTCWYRHPIAAEELTALMVAHRAAYDTRSAKAAGIKETRMPVCLRLLRRTATWTTPN